MNGRIFTQGNLDLFAWMRKKVLNGFFKKGFSFFSGSSMRAAIATTLHKYCSRIIASIMKRKVIYEIFMLIAFTYAKRAIRF